MGEVIELGAFHWASGAEGRPANVLGRGGSGAELTTECIAFGASNERPGAGPMRRTASCETVLQKGEDFIRCGWECVSPWPIGHDDGEFAYHRLACPHNGAHAQHVGDINVTGRVESGCSMIWRNVDHELGFVLHPAHEREIHGHLGVDQVRYPCLGDSLLALNVCAPSECFRFTKGHFESAEDNRLELRAHSRKGSHYVSGSIACVMALDSEHDAVEVDLSDVGLVVYGPCCM